MTVGGGMPGADFDDAASRELDAHDDVIAHGYFLRFANGHGSDGPAVHAVDEITLDERFNRFFAGRRCNGRVR